MNKFIFISKLLLLGIRFSIEQKKALKNVLERKKIKTISTKTDIENMYMLKITNKLIPICKDLINIQFFALIRVRY